MTAPTPPTAAAFCTLWEAEDPPLPPELAGEVLYGWVSFPPASLTDLPATAAEWLEVAGLPTDAAPALSFGRRGEPCPPLTVSHGAPGRYGRFFVLGSDGAGDPLCLDPDADGAVVRVDHDLIHHPGPPRVQFVNGDLPRFAACLLAYKRAVRTVIAGGGDLADGFPPGVSAELWSAVAAADPGAVAAGAYWGEIVRSR